MSNSTENAHLVKFTSTFPNPIEIDGVYAKSCPDSDSMIWLFHLDKWPHWGRLIVYKNPARNVFRFDDIIRRWPLERQRAIYRLLMAACGDNQQAEVEE